MPDRLAAYEAILDEQEVCPNTLSELIQGVSKKNYDSPPMWHALGFLHCRIATFPTGTLRLHIWPKGIRHASEQANKIHNHIFSLRSTVLCGTLKNVRYDVAPSDHTPESYQFHKVEYLHDGSRLKPTTEYCKAIALDSEHYQAGQTYSIAIGQFHETVVRDLFVATLVSTYDHREISPRMLGRKNTTIQKRSTVLCEETMWSEQLAYLQSALEIKT